MQAAAVEVICTASIHRRSIPVDYDAGKSWTGGGTIEHH